VVVVTMLVRSFWLLAVVTMSFVAIKLCTGFSYLMLGYLIVFVY